MIVLFSLFVLIIVLAVLNGIKDNKKAVLDGTGGYSNYLSYNYTQTVKGIFIIIVFFSHFNTYVDYTAFTDRAYHYSIHQIGQMMVTMFLFYSGYGVMESIKKGGGQYIHAIPRHRVLGTLIKFDIVVIIFSVLNLILGRDLSFARLLEALIAWENIGNSNWYIFAILVLYLFTYISGLITKGKPIKIATWVSLLTIVYIFVLMMVRFNDAQFYNTILCYPLGMFFSLYREQIEEYLLKSKTKYAVVLFFLFALLVITKTQIHSGTSPAIIFEGLVFTLFVVVLTMRIPIKSKTLSWCGNYLFEIYILQRLPMIVFKEMGLSEVSIYLYFIACFIVTLGLARLFRLSTQWIKL